MKKYITHIILFCVCAGFTIGYLTELNTDYEAQKQEWSQVAAEAFKEALQMEVDKRLEIPFFHYRSEEGGVRPSKQQLPDSVRILSQGYGSRWYKLDKKRFERQLIEGGHVNANLSALIDEYPYSVDALKHCWDSLLNRQLRATTAIRYVLTDLGEYNDTTFANRDYFVYPIDSSLVSYIGYRCEAEFVGCVHYPSIWMACSLKEWMLLFLPWMLLAFVLSFYQRIHAAVHRRFTTKEIVHVADARLSDAKIYQLGNGAVYDVFSQTIRRGGAVSKLAPQSANLFLLFLREPEHQVTTDEIDQYLWRGKGTKEQLHTAIRRLRNELKLAPIELSIENLKGTYQLKIIHSIEENNLVSNG